MADDWGADDPFTSPDDPEAAAREQRRREREERRQAREGGGETPPPSGSPPASSPPAATPPPPPPAPDPPVPPRSAEEEFWDEDPEAFEEEEQEPAPPAPASPRRPRAPSGPRAPRPGAGVLGAMRRHPLRIVGAVVGLLALWFLVALFQPLHGSGSGRVEVTIPKGSSVSEVGDILGEKGVVSSSTLFQVRVTIAGKRSSLYPGRFVMAEDMPYGDAIDTLSTAPVKQVSTI